MMTRVASEWPCLLLEHAGNSGNFQNQLLPLRNGPLGQLLGAEGWADAAMQLDAACDNDGRANPRLTGQGSLTRGELGP